LLETLREYWRWKKPKTWLFPGEPRGNGEHLTDKAVWYACAEAARHAGLKKRVSPHMLRHYAASRTMPRVGAHAAIHRHLNCVDTA
jgi:site-specific recombinase XerD